MAASLPGAAAAESVVTITFEWGIALHGIHAAQNRAETEGEKSAQSRAVVKKIARQMAKDYLVFSRR